MKGRKFLVIRKLVGCDLCHDNGAMRFIGKDTKAWTLQMNIKNAYNWNEFKKTIDLCLETLRRNSWYCE